MRFEWSWPQVTVFVATLAVCAVLVALGKVGESLLATPLALLVPAGPTPRPTVGGP